MKDSMFQRNSSFVTPVTTICSAQFLQLHCMHVSLHSLVQACTVSLHSLVQTCTVSLHLLVQTCTVSSHLLVQTIINQLHCMYRFFTSACTINHQSHIQFLNICFWHVPLWIQQTRGHMTKQSSNQPIRDQFGVGSTQVLITKPQQLCAQSAATYCGIKVEHTSLCAAHSVYQDPP